MTYTAETWPIACAMLPFGGKDSTCLLYTSRCV